MTPPGALWVTGMALVLIAMLLKAQGETDEAMESSRRRMFHIAAWSVVSVAVACVVGAAWWEALA